MHAKESLDHGIFVESPKTKTKRFVRCNIRAVGAVPAWRWPRGKLGVGFGRAAFEFFGRRPGESGHDDACGNWEKCSESIAFCYHFVLRAAMGSAGRDVALLILQ